MHIPKTGGAALIGELRATMASSSMVGGFDLSMFGSQQIIASMGDAARSQIYLAPDAVPSGAELVVAHMSYNTLRQAYPMGQLVTIVREPFSRLLSLWTYWRTRLDSDLDGFGLWGDVVRLARDPLAEFLSSPMAACQTDNVTTRMLLWPHPLISGDAFIDPAHDAMLLEEARARLSTFALVDMAESSDRSALRTWFGLPLGHKRANETPSVTPNMRAQLNLELTSHALDRLEASSRLDLALWQSVGRSRMTDGQLEQLRSRMLLVTAARHAALLEAAA
jgi:hypothetical protein